VSAPIETPMTQELETEIKRERLTATSRCGATARPRVAALVAFLASPTRRTSRRIYTVDGGAMA